MIAILMSTYNGSLFIKEQIESILKQTNKEWLLYIRDDGSTDDTRMILQEYAKKNPNKIHLLRDEFMNIGITKENPTETNKVKCNNNTQKTTDTMTFFPFLTPYDSHPGFMERQRYAMKHTP